MADEVLRNIAATKGLLAAVRGRPGFSNVASGECRRLMALVKGSTHLGPEALAKIADAVKSVEFPPSDENALLDTSRRCHFACSGGESIGTWQADGHAKLRDLDEFVSRFVLGSDGSRLRDGGLRFFGAVGAAGAD